MPTIKEFQTHVESAERNFREKNYDEADTAIKHALAAVDDANAAKEDFSGLLLARLAKVTRDYAGWLEDGKPHFDDAQRILGKGIIWYPDDVILHSEQGWLHYVLGRYDKALVSFEDALSRVTELTSKDDRIYALEGAGAALRELDRLEDAEAKLAEAIGSDSTVPPGILIERGWLRLYQRRFDSAFADFENAICAGLEHTDRVEARSGQIAACHASEAEQLGNIKTSARKLIDSWMGQQDSPTEEVIRSVETSVAVHSGINNYKAALLGCEELLRLDSDNIDFYAKKISALNWLRRFGEAEDTFTRAMEGVEKKFKKDADQARKSVLDLLKELAYVYYRQRSLMKAYGIFSGESLPELIADASEREEIAVALKNDVGAIEWTIVVLRRIGPPDEAQKQVVAALERFPNNIELLTELGAVHFNNQEYDKAKTVFEHVLKEDEYVGFAYQWLAGALRKQCHFEEANKCIDRALKVLPMETRLWEERAWIAFDQGNLEQADAYFAKAIQLDYSLIQRQFTRVEVLSQLNRTDEALEIFAELEKEFPNDPEVAEQRGWFHLRRGELAEAKKQFRAIQDGDLNNVLALNGFGGLHLEEGDYSSAETVFRTAVELIDYEPQYHINLAWALLRQIKNPGETPTSEASVRNTLFVQSIASCRNALRIDPYNAKAYLCLGVIAFKRDALMDAEAYFQKSVKLNPRDGGHVELGSLYVQMGRYEEAETQLKQAIAINKNDVRAYVEIANLYLLTWRITEAIRLCRHAVAVDSNDEGANRGLAIALMRAGQYEEAEKFLRSAIARLSLRKRCQLRLLLTQILIRLGDDKNKDRDLYTEALKQINDAKRENSASNADIYFHAGIVHHRLEDYRSARKSFADCRKANRDYFEAERYEKSAKAAIHQERRISKINFLGGLFTAILCVILLSVIWTLYFTNRTRPVVWPDLAEVIKQAQEAKQAGIMMTEPMTTVVDRSMLTFMTPLLIGLLVVGLLLPNLNKLKLPGGFEAEISEVKTKENISSGPKGDIGFGSSLPIVSPGPGSRSLTPK
jgi:tetratricopeptide (TPR) repeat protein